MKKAHIMGLLGAATLSLAGGAWAGQWTGYVQIANLDTSGDAYIVYSSSTLNPAGCAATGQAVVYPSSTAAEKDLMNKTLLSAFLANRKVRLDLSVNTCSGGFPTYYQVRVDSAL
jgi:hypothetical protein